MYNRTIKQSIIGDCFKEKAIIVVGARQTGKTTLVKGILDGFSGKSIKYFDAEDPETREVFNNKGLIDLIQVVAAYDVIVIDEAQKIPTIGQSVKLLVDHFKAEKQFIITGSSTLNLLDQTEEPLTGRIFVYTLFPLSLEEIFPDKEHFELLRGIPLLLRFGEYPGVVTTNGLQLKQRKLSQLTTNYLYKDLLQFQQIKNPDILRKLLKALALQVGSIVSYTELSSLLDIDKNTVARYIDLLEKSFVIFRVSPHFSNKRKEISKRKKIYFYDIGIRNALINNFSSLDQRNDVGALWENFMMVERMKYRHYHRIYANQYFWQSYDGAEIDLVEEREGKLFGYEFKWKEKKVATPALIKASPENEFKVISKKNLKDFVL